MIDFGNDDRVGAALEAPGAAEGLRELVFACAVRGRLEDQPLDRARATLRTRLKAGSAPSQNPPALVDYETEYPFQVPPSWTWVHLGDALDLVNGYPFKPSEWARAGMPIIRIQNLNDPTAPFNFVATPVPDKVIVRPGDLLVSWSGSFGAFIWDREPAALNQHIFRCLPRDNAYELAFLRLAINSRLDEIRARAHGMSFRHITKGKLEGLWLPLPPRAEQSRIVKQVDALLGQIEEFERAQHHQGEARNRLRDTLFRGVVADEAIDAAAALRTLTNNIDELILSPSDVADTRRLAIDLAVRRRLVPRRGPRDARLLGSLVQLQNGYAFESSWYEAHGVRLVRNQNVGHGVLDWEDERRISEARASAFERFLLEDGDIVLSLDRPIISTGLKVARVRNQDLPALLLQRVARPQYLGDELDPAFLFMWLQSSAFIDRIAPGRSNGVPHISSRQVERLEIDLPPIDEQHEILEIATALLQTIDALSEAIGKAVGIHAALAPSEFQR